MHDVILHHYGTSPYSEKARLALGFKGIAWRSVTIPNIMPKPDLLALTGGYRKTPVLQIGADIYCDTARILRELDRRFPRNPLLPTPQAEVLAGWAEAKTFGPAVGIVFAHIGERVTRAFMEDRAKFLGRDLDPARLRRALPYMHDQVRAALTVYDEMLADGRPFLLGDALTAGDLAAYHPLWFLDTRAGEPLGPQSRYPRVLAWMKRVAEVGHGTATELTSAEAIEIARASKPAPPPSGAADLLGVAAGDLVTVTPDDTGREPATGVLIGADAREVVIRHEDARAGTVHVHFPRLGFAVAPAR